MAGSKLFVCEEPDCEICVSVVSLKHFSDPFPKKLWLILVTPMLAVKRNTDKAFDTTFDRAGCNQYKNHRNEYKQISLIFFLNF